MFVAAMGMAGTAAQQYAAEPGPSALLQERKAHLAGLPDARGIVFVGGGKDMLGAITASLWVSVLTLLLPLPMLLLLMIMLMCTMHSSVPKSRFVRGVHVLELFHAKLVTVRPAVCDVAHDMGSGVPQTLRHKLNCTLPAEIAYIGKKNEVEPAAIAALNATLGPVYALDLSAVPYPAHHNP